MATFTIIGKVTDQNNKPQAGLIVRASDLDFKGENALGRPVRTDERGQYEIEYDSKEFVIDGRETTAADLLVRVFDANGLLLAKSVLLRGSEQSQEQQAGKEPVEINLVIGTNSDTESSPIVRGTVRVDGTPTKNIVVSAYDQDLPSKNSDQLLGQCRTDEFGHYYIPYILKSARKAERGSADVYVKVAEKDHRFEAASSATVFNAGLETLIDLDLKGKVKEDNTEEYDRYLTQLSPVLDGALIHELTPEDLSFLANETGIAAEHLAYLRWSHLWETASKKVKAYTFYAFLREGFSSDMAYWIDKKQVDYAAAMDAALKNNIIANGSFKVEDVMEFVAQKSLQSGDDVTKTPLQIVLNTVLDSNIAVQLAADYIRHEPQNGDFWEAANNNKEYGEAIPKIKFGFDVLDLTLQNEVLTQALLSENITDTRALVDKNHEDWVYLMTPATQKRSAKEAFTFPDSIKGETDDEKRKNYADTIMAGLEQKHPADFVVKDLKRPVGYSGNKIWDTIKEESRKEDFDILAFDTDQVTDNEVKKQIIALQNEVRAYPGFAETIKNSGYWTEEKVTEVPENTIKKGEKAFFEESGYDLKKPVGIYLMETEKDPFFDTVYAEDIKAAVEQRYRVQLIARNAEQAGKLLEGRVFSPMDVVNLSPSTKKRLNEAGLKDQEIDEIKDKATEVVTTAQYLASELYIHFNHTNPMVMGNNRETLKLTRKQEKSNARGAGTPSYDVVSATYEALFGSTSTCACEQCLSVYGAAAYFVDFLHTLLKEGEAGSPGQKLLARRPDLQYIKLNCENTNTRVPYIDLVNEIFEMYIAHDNLDQKDKVRNSNKKAADIAREPEYLIKEAYDELNKVVYPLNLPFDREYVSTDVYLETAGTSRFEVLQSAGGEKNEEQMTRAILGLSPAEYELFTNPYEKFYRLLDEIKPEALEDYRQQLSDPEIRKGNFADFLSDLDARTQIVDSRDKSLRDFYESIKNFTLTDEEWGIFKSIFLEGERKIYAPSHLFGLDKIDKLYYNTTELSSTNISQVSTFMERTGLSMEELIKILKVKSVLSPFTEDGELLYKVLDGPNSDSCNIDHLYLRYKDSTSAEQAVDDFTFVRICRFIRLWKKLNCGIEILDHLLQALYKGRRRAVKDEFNGKISYFDVFEPGVLTQLAYAVALQKQLNWSLEKITLLFEEEVAAIPETEKSIRKAELAKKMNLGMDWADFVAFASEDKNFSPKQVYHLLQWHQTIRQAGFQAKEMRYLLHHSPIAEKDRLTDQEVLQFTKKLRDGIRKVATDTAAQADLTADFILEKLKLVYEDATVLKLWADFLNRTQGAKDELKIKNNESGLPKLFIDTEIDTIDAQLSSGEKEGFKSIFKILYDYLTEAFLIQTISSEFKLEVATAKLLINKIHDKWQGDLKKDFIDNLPLSEGKYWITPPKTEEYVFHTISPTGSSPALILEWENQDKNNPLLAGKFYKTKVKITPLTLQWEARTYKAAIINEQYLFADSIVDSIKTKMQQFDKFALLVNKFKLSSAELEWMLEHKDNFDNLPLHFDPSTAFTYAHWLRLANYTALKKALNDEDGQDLVELFRLAKLGSSDLQNHLLYLTQWKATDLRETIVATNFKNEIYLSELLRKKHFRDKYGFELTSDLLFETVKTGILSRYTDEARDTLQKKAEDRLRSLRRNPLMGYLLEYKKPDEKIKTPNDLYAYFLIDVEMEPNVTTSRIVQANATLQLFAQRVLMNLEDINPKEIDSKWYEWMHKYRVWEANRKVFLYPENWIEPELRDDKSEIFKALESELLQGEVTQENAVKALGTYLYALDEIARLDVRAFCEDPENGELHVVARTFTVPHIYYYRKRKKDMVWTPWEKMDVGIEGDAINMVIAKETPFLFWLSFLENQKGQGEDNRELNIKLSYSINNSKKWASKKTSEHSIKSQTLDTTKYYITSEFDGKDFTINIWNVELSSLTGNSLGEYFYGGYKDDIMKREKSRLALVLKEIYDTNSLFGKIDSNSERILTVKQKPVQNLVPNITLISYPEPMFNLAIGNSPSSLNFLFDKNLDSNIRITTIRSLPIANFRECFFYSDASFSFLAQLRKYLQNSTRVGRDGIRLPQFSIKEMVKVSFNLFSHPFTKDFLRLYNSKTVGLYNIQDAIWFDLDNSIFPVTNNSDNYFVRKYSPIKERWVKPYPLFLIEFNKQGSYSSYNWELFFHIPLLIANRLSQNQRYQEAQQWYHYIFNPTTDEVPPEDGHGGVSRFWQFLPFRQAVAEGKESIVEILKKLYTEDPKAPGSTSNQIDIWRNDPFNPHAIARSRIQAYMRNVVGKYIDNLIQWGDMLFRQDSMESINEATQLYILAANILGPRPVRVPSSRTAERFHYAELKGKGIDKFGNTLYNFTPRQTNDGRTDDQIAAQLRAAQFYFCIPDNTFILKYWDTVADRLFKIRHGQNIEGIERQLDLFEPEIDPALLVRARAMGMDIGSILRDLQAPLPHYRFNVMLQKALEMCAELRGLGGSLLSAIEKKEAEALAMIRQKHEVQMLNLVTEIKRGSVQEAQENLNGLNESLNSANKRFEYYSKKEKMNELESQAQSKSSTAHDYEMVAQGFSVAAAAAYLIPQFHGQGMASGTSFGGQQIGKSLESQSSKMKFISNQFSYESIMAKTMADYDRRKEEWDFQRDLAKIEQEQINKQILAAEIRVNIAQRDLDNHLQQIENARQIEDFLRSKFSNQELYSWMEREIKTLYNQCYQMVYDYAKRAEKTYRYELGVESSDFIRFGAWDSNRNGLLAGEKLYIGLKQLEKAYMDQNRRELELTKHISLNQLNPLALLYLREQGKCDFAIPEALFDLDFPGHYMRRIKSVSITIPCVAGPYTSINATLRLKKSSTRVKASAGNGYPRVEGDDDRFRDQFTGIQSIATSSAQNDSGLFELNFRDERYLPFEGAGAINSEWTLEMMSDPTLRQFDYNTISDVVVHMRYTAREDGGLKTAAITNLKGLTDKLGKESLARLFSLRHDFPNEWHTWAKQNQPLSIKLQKHHFPYFAQMGSLDIGTIEAYEKGKTMPDAVVLTKNGNATTGCTITGELDKTKEDWFLIVHYTI